MTNKRNVRVLIDPRDLTTIVEWASSRTGNHNGQTALRYMAAAIREGGLTPSDKESDNATHKYE